DELRLYVGAAGDLHGYDAATKTLAGLAPVYDLDAAGDRWVALNNLLNSGRGTGDLAVYVPASLLGGGAYVYLYSRFGALVAADGQGESWCVRPAATLPADPGTAIISGTVYQDFIHNGIQDP